MAFVIQSLAVNVLNIYHFEYFSSLNSHFQLLSIWVILFLQGVLYYLILVESWLFYCVEWKLQFSLI